MLKVFDNLYASHQSVRLTAAYRWDGVAILVGCYGAMRPCILPDGTWCYVDDRDLRYTTDATDPTVWVSDYYQQG